MKNRHEKGVYDDFFHTPPLEKDKESPNLFQLWEDIADLSSRFLSEGTDIFGTFLSNMPRDYCSWMNQALCWSTPLTVFSPPIMNDALSTFASSFYQTVEKKPDDFSGIVVRYMDQQQRLFMQCFWAIVGERLSSDPWALMHMGTWLDAYTKEGMKDDVKRWGDRRFSHHAWEYAPIFRYLKDSYVLLCDVTQDLLEMTEGMDHAMEQKVRFYAKQWLEALSPTNHPLTNPDVLQETLRTKGENLRKGFANFKKDFEKGSLSMTDMTAFEVGKSIAATKGVVVFENEFLQLIRYTPTQPKVFSVPLLIVPAWINKYYLFDLSAQSSFVNWCVERGMDVFMISWVNPPTVMQSPVTASSLRHKKARSSQKTFSNYTLDGLLSAVKAVQDYAISGKINVVGNCAGGIMLNCLMAYLEETHYPSPFASATTLASPIDGDKLGEMKAFICKGQINMLEESLDDVHAIPGKILMQSFNLLRPNDLLWSFFIKHYWLGKDPEPFDILFWNCDTTNLPSRMHSEYLRAIFLENQLMKPYAMTIGGVPIDISSIKTPSFIVGAQRDHIAPWDAVYTLASKIQSDVKEFLLTGSGHVSGIINPPFKKKYGFWTNASVPQDENEWLQGAKKHEGSWWNYWLDWIEPFSGHTIAPLSHKECIEEAPGRYVRGEGCDVPVPSKQSQQDDDAWPSFFFKKSS